MDLAKLYGAYVYYPYTRVREKLRPVKKWTEAFIEDQRFKYQLRQRIHHNKLEAKRRVDAETHMRTAKSYLDACIGESAFTYMRNAAGAAKHLAIAKKLDPRVTLSNDTGPLSLDFLSSLALYYEAHGKFHTCLEGTRLNRKNLREALKAIDRALIYSPDHPRYMELKAQILFNLRTMFRSYGAPQYIRAAILVHPTDVGLRKVQDSFEK